MKSYSSPIFLVLSLLGIGAALTFTIQTEAQGPNVASSSRGATATASFSRPNEVHVYTLQDDYVHPVEPTEQMTFTQFGITNFEGQYWDSGQWGTIPGAAVTGNNKVWRTQKREKWRSHYTNAAKWRSTRLWINGK